MIPVHFGRRDRLLFGVYSPGRNPRHRRGAVILNPWGMEALRAHRALKLLGDSLAASGYHVLRFDYFGTGDSFGSGRDVTVAGCQADSATAVDELRAISGVTNVVVIGLRLGALIGAVAARNCRGVERVVLWDPVLNGSQYLEELQAASPGRDASDSGEMEIGGFPLPVELQEELRDSAPLDPSAGQMPVLLALSSMPSTFWDDGWERGRISVAMKESAPCWREEQDFGAGQVPVELIRSIQEWLE